MAKREKKPKESKWVYVPFVILVLVIALIVALPYITPKHVNNTVTQASMPLFTFAKVSNQDFAPSGKTEVYFVSWYGCPYGAADSWGIYLALTHYGTVNATPNLSDVEGLEAPNGSLVTLAVPGLIFKGFEPNSSVGFHALYILGRVFKNDTASLTNGTIIPTSEVLQVELNELKSEAPQWVYNLIYNYQVESGLVYETSLPHIASTIIITGPNGTWMLIGYDENVSQYLPYVIASSGYNATQILNFIKEGKLPSSLSVIDQEASQILEIIKEAEG